jgi:hypothetical protein
MPDSPAHALKGCLVLVTTDGENFHRTRIAEVTPSGHYVRLEQDEPAPGGIQRWRKLASIQLLETYTSLTSLPVTHGIVRLKKSPGSELPSRPTAWIDPVPAEASNILTFPFSASSKTDATRTVPVHAALSP